MDMMVELVKAGLATTKRERIVADGRQTAVVRVRITDAGRQALAKMSK
jgi:acyl-coenzyme A thioesterase PaaI-like protein